VDHLQQDPLGVILRRSGRKCQLVAGETEFAILHRFQKPVLRASVRQTEAG
jgi:hypothetical protein